jgi:hypothetical protein
VPGKKERVAARRVAVLAEPVRQSVQPGEILVAAVVGDDVVADLHQARESLTERGKLLGPKQFDVLAMAQKRLRRTAVVGVGVHADTAPGAAPATTARS